MIRKNLLQLLFSGACLWRWNDKLRPVELSEIEKQAHKMLVACILWHETSQEMGHEASVSLGTKIIEGALFDYFYRIIITDIKPPVFYKIRENPEHYNKLTEFTLSNLESRLAPLGSFWDKMKAWHRQIPEEEDLPRQILGASHLFASQWEFNLIRPHNPFDEEMEGIAASFHNGLARYSHLPGMDKLLDRSHALGKFANLCGQLRFQIRWTQVPRIPATSVLGHMFIVAATAYLFSVAINTSPARANNNFFSGLFHDFPELLTRDIISPVKGSYSGLSQLIREYEKAELERRVLGPLRKAGLHSLAERISYYLGLEIGSEFRECCRIDGKIISPEGFDALCELDFNENDPRDGILLKKCDLLGAWLEAQASIRNGVAPPHLVEALPRLRSQLLEDAPECMRLDSLLADFD